MRDISDELLYALNLPMPPNFSLCQDKLSTYKVPDFCGYESSSTRWIIAILTNKTSLKRLIKCGKNYENIFSRYYQVPDRPIELMGKDYPLETPAYHQQSVLYLTPLALALYMKQISAVEMLLDLKNESGRKIVHPAEACFVQRVFKKGDKRITNELSNTFPIIIAIRRSFYEGITLLVENGFSTQKQFSVIYRKPFRESVSLYRDVLDYVVTLLRHRPGLNVTKIVKIIIDPSIGLTTYDIFVFDIELDDLNNWDYVSIFRRICRIGYGTRYFIEESATQVLNILEQIQIIGYFGGIEHLHMHFNGPLPSFFQKVLTKQVVDELQSERISIVMGQIPTIIKSTRDDLFKLDKIELTERINYDYQCCIGILFLWFQRCLHQERCSHYAKLASLLTRIMMDTKIVEDFFKKTDKELASVFTEWSQSVIKATTIFNFRIRLQDYILFTDHLCVAFINTYGENPQVLINAPMLHDKQPEQSPIIRDLIIMCKANKADEAAAAEVANTNQSNQNTNPRIFSVVDATTKFAINFIPANHARNFALDYPLRMNGLGSFRHASLNRTLFDSKSHLNNANSWESLKTASVNDGRNNLPYPPDNCDPVVSIKSPIEYHSDRTGTTVTQTVVQGSPSDVLFRPKMPKEITKRQKTSKAVRRTRQRRNKAVQIITMIPNEKLKERLQQLLSSNEKYRDIKLTSNTEKVPLQFLRPEIQKYKSVDKMIKLLQSKHSTQLDCLYNNLDAVTMMGIMKRLSFHTSTSNEKSSNNEFSQVFQYRT